MSSSPDHSLRAASFGDIDAVVGALREIRTAARPPGQRAAPARLPSRGVIAHILAGLSAALFPNRLGAAGDAGGNVDAFVARTLINALDDLAQQVRLDLRFAADEAADEGDLAERAKTIVTALGARLPAIRRCLDGDIDAAFTGDPAARSVDEILACYPGVTAILHHRVAHELNQLGAPLVARIIAEIAHSLTGIDIHPGGRIEKGTARHPIVEDDVVIYANATILGRITIGRGSVIGGNVWLTRSIAPGSVISQALVRSDRYGDGGGI